MKESIDLSPALKATLEGSRGLVLFSCKDKTFTQSAFIDLARTYMFEFAADIAIIMGAPGAYKHEEFFSHFPEDPDPMNSAVFSREIKTDLKSTLKSALRMDAGILLIDAPVDEDAFDIVLTAAETGQIVILADSDGDPKSMQERLQLFAAKSENPKLCQQILTNVLKRIYLRDDDGSERMDMIS